MQIGRLRPRLLLPGPESTSASAEGPNQLAHSRMISTSRKSWEHRCDVIIKNSIQKGADGAATHLEDNVTCVVLVLREKLDHDLPL